MCKMQKEIIQDEITEFIRHCKEANLNFHLIYENSLAALRSEEGQKEKPRKKLLITGIIFAFVLITILYFYSDTVAIHSCAIGRIIMVKVAPYFDWRNLKYKKCLISKLFASQDRAVPNVLENCFYCDAVVDIPTVNDDNTADISDVIKSYWDIDAPIILQNVSNNFNLQKLLNDYDYLDYEPCDIASNVHFQRYSTAENIFIKLTKVPMYWFHMSNCNMQAAKLFRRHFPRPNYLHVDFAPVQQSWLLMSFNLPEIQTFKTLKLIDSLAIIQQIQGVNIFRLRPTYQCEDQCDDMVIHLKEEKVLVVSDKWEIEYMPFGNNLNIAVILETH